MRGKQGIVFLPVRDEAGRLQAMDVSYYFPWSQWTDFATNVATGELGDAFKGSGVLSGPLTSIITAVTTGKDAFTQRDIVQPGDPTAEQAKAITAYVWDMAMPPMMSSNGVVSPMWLLDPAYGGKMAQAAGGSTNRYGDERATWSQAALRLVGANVYGVDPEVTFAINSSVMKADAQKVRARLRSIMSDRGLTEEQRREKMEAYAAEFQKRAEKLRKYQAEAAPPEFAKKQREPATAP